MTLDGYLMGVSAQAGKVHDQRVVFLADGCGDLVGNVLFRLAAFVAGVDSTVLAVQHATDNRRFDYFGDLVGLIARQGSLQFSHRVIDNGFQFFHGPLSSPPESTTGGCHLGNRTNIAQPGKPHSPGGYSMSVPGRCPFLATSVSPE